MQGYTYLIGSIRLYTLRIRRSVGANSVKLQAAYIMYTMCEYWDTDYIQTELNGASIRLQLNSKSEVHEAITIVTALDINIAAETEVFTTCITKPWSSH